MSYKIHSLLGLVNHGTDCICHRACLFFIIHVDIPNDA